MYSAPAPDPMVEIQALARQAKEAEGELIEERQNLKNLKEQGEGIKAELLALNLTPETLDAEIARLEQERTAKIQEARRLLNPVA